MAPAAEVDRQLRRWLCRSCANRRQKVVLISDNAHLCTGCGDFITVPAKVTEGVSA
jgi:hypothetical protein